MQMLQSYLVEPRVPMPAQQRRSQPWSTPLSTVEYKSRPRTYDGIYLTLSPVLLDGDDAATSSLTQHHLKYAFATSHTLHHQHAVTTPRGSQNMAEAELCRPCYSRIDTYDSGVDIATHRNGRCLSEDVGSHCVA
jgi:hypothetical protein